MKLGLFPCYVKTMGMSNRRGKKLYPCGNGIENPTQRRSGRTLSKNIVDRGVVSEIFPVRNRTERTTGSNLFPSLKKTTLSEDNKGA